jgi:hypothetical protein
MWTAARRNENRRLEPAQKRTFGAGFIRVPGTGICGWSVDHMCIQLYESNQRSKYYNKILLGCFDLG